MDYTNKALGLRVQTQIPLNVKEYKENEASLKDLGTANNLAFIYEQGLIVYCIEEGTRWEWREVQSGEENTGLLDIDFVYPDNIITFGIDYSNKSYNFFTTEIVIETPPLQTVINTGTYAGKDSGHSWVNIMGGSVDSRVVEMYSDVGLSGVDRKRSFVNLTNNSLEISNVKGYDDARIYLSEGHINLRQRRNDSFLNTEFVFDTPTNNTVVHFPNKNIDGDFTLATLDDIPTVDGSETKINAGTNVTKTGTGTTVDPYVINATDTNTTYSAGTSLSLVGTTFNNTAPDQTVVLTQGGATTITGTYPNFTISSTDTNTTYTAGSGLQLVGTVFSVENLQKVITYPADFTGTDYTLTNADNNYEIIVDNGATAVSITVPSGLTSKIGVGFTQKGTADVSYTASGTTINNPIGLKIKGQYYQTYLSQELATNIFYLGGSTKV